MFYLPGVRLPCGLLSSCLSVLGPCNIFLDQSLGILFSRPQVDSGQVLRSEQLLYEECDSVMFFMFKVKSNPNKTSVKSCFLKLRGQACIYMESTPKGQPRGPEFQVLENRLCPVFYHIFFSLKINSNFCFLNLFSSLTST